MSAYREDYTQPPIAPQPSGPVPVAIPDRTPWVTFALLVVTIAVFLWQLVSPWPAQWGDKNNAAILAGQYWRLITPVLLHAGILHIGFNMYALFAIGSGLERRMGHGRFLLLYLLGGFAGNVLSFLLSAHNSVGASTAIFGLLAAEGMFVFQNRRLFGPDANRTLGNIVMVAGINLVLGLSPGIDNWGHVGGLLGGLIFSALGGPNWEVRGIYPNLHVVDLRQDRQVALGAALVLVLFGGLTALKFFWA